VYADPELAIIAAISENDIAARRATILVRIKEMMTDGPAYIAAACPLKVNIPMPKKEVQSFLLSLLSMSPTDDGTKTYTS
jgi:hypothetical protein